MQSDFMGQLRGRLAELGCPAGPLQRLVREVSEHREDIEQAALAEGLSAAAAATRVQSKLGDPLDLAEHQMVMLRQTSWAGRHFFVSFFLLPLLLVPVLWGLMMALDLAVEFALGFGWDGKKLGAAWANPHVFHYLVLAVNGADMVAVGLVTLVFCWLGRRSAVSFPWILTACVICSLYALVIYVRIQPHNFTVGFYRNLWCINWVKAAIPLLMAGGIYAGRRRKARTFFEKPAA